MRQLPTYENDCPRSFENDRPHTETMCPQTTMTTQVRKQNKMMNGIRRSSLILGHHVSTHQCLPPPSHHTTHHTLPSHSLTPSFPPPLYYTTPLPPSPSLPLCITPHHTLPPHSLPLCITPHHSLPPPSLPLCITPHHSLPPPSLPLCITPHHSLPLPHSPSVLHHTTTPSLTPPPLD